MTAAVSDHRTRHAAMKAELGQYTVTENIDKDPKRGFTHLGDFAQAVGYNSPAARRGIRGIEDRMKPVMSAPSTFAGEGTGADGGFLIPPDFAQAIFSLSLDEDSFLPLTDNLELGGNSLLLPKDELTPWGTSGPRAYWVSEANPIPVSKPNLTGLSLRLKKLAAITPVTEELTRDGLALAGYLTTRLASSMRWKANAAILFGGGTGIPGGAMTSGGAVTITKDPGQASNTLSATNLANMMARLPPGSLKRSFWLINNDVLPALFTLTLGNFPVFFPHAADGSSFTDAPAGKLFGRPIVISQQSNTFGQAGDISLLDLSYYQSCTKAEGIQTATSMHLYFDADSLAYRIVFRVDGQPKLTAPITPNKGSNPLSPFVQLGAR